MEIITGVERRRRWRVEEKLRIVAECERPGACLAAVARQNDVSSGSLWNWRRVSREGRADGLADARHHRLVRTKRRGPRAGGGGVPDCARRCPGLGQGPPGRGL